MILGQRTAGARRRDFAGPAETAVGSAVNAPYTKTIVCLANSRKPPSGRCVAGREVSAAGFGGWVRAVSARATHEVSLRERRYADGRDPRVLDVIAIPMARPQPQQHQQENHVIDTSKRWLKQGAVAWQALQPAVEDPAGPLWCNGHSSHHGHNDRVPEACLAELSRSLYLVRPERLRLVVAAESGEMGLPRRRVRARFRLCEHEYCLAVTDPWMEFECLAKNEPETLPGEALLCLSLSERFHGFVYKLVATVLTPPRPGD